MSGLGHQAGVYAMHRDTITGAGFISACVSPQSVEGDALDRGFASDQAKFLGTLTQRVLHHVENRAESARVYAVREVADKRAKQREVWHDRFVACLTIMALISLGSLVTYLCMSTSL